MNLNGLSFPIDFNSFHTFLVNTIPNADGFVTTSNGYLVVEKNQFTQTDIDNINNYYNSLTQAGEIAKGTPSINTIVTNRVTNAIAFGQQIIIQYAVSNILAGITQAQKTKEVSDYLNDLQGYLTTGSLYAAITEITNLVAGPPPADLSPFVTVDILNNYATQIRNYLNT